MVFHNLNPNGVQSIYRQIKTDYIADFSSHLVKRDSYYGLFLRAVHCVCKAIGFHHRFQILDTSMRLRHAIAKISVSELAIQDEAKRKAVEHSLRGELLATRESLNAAHRWFVCYLFGSAVKDIEISYTYDAITKLVRAKAIGGKDRDKYDHQLTHEIFKRLLDLKEEDVEKLGFPPSCIQKMLEKAFLGLDFTAKGVDWRWQADQTPLVCFKDLARNPGGLDKVGVTSEITPFALRALLHHFQKTECQDLIFARCYMNGRHCEVLKSFLGQVKATHGFMLSLSGNDIDDACVEAIVDGVLANPNREFYINVLNLSKNPKITERGAAAVAKLVASGKVCSLYMSDCPIHDSGAKRIADALSNPSCTLKHIELHNTHSGLQTFQSLMRALINGHSLEVLTFDLQIHANETFTLEQFIKTNNLHARELLSYRITNLPAIPRLAAILLQLAHSDGNLQNLVFEFAERVNLSEAFIIALKKITPTTLSTISMPNGHLTPNAIASLGPKFSLEEKKETLATEQPGIIKVQLNDGLILKYRFKTPHT